MGYTPYKMKGHELKGIKQRGVPFTGGVGSREDRTGVADKITPSPNKLFGAIGAMFGKKKKGKKSGGGIMNIKEMDARITALEEGGGGGDGAAAAEMATSDPMHGDGSGKPMPVGPDGKVVKKPLGLFGSNAAPGDPLAGNATQAVSMLSDVRLKEKIKKVGKSPSGIPIYMFNYIGENKRYKGTMAQDLICMGIDAVEIHESGYYMVDYNKIDVDMKLIN